MEESSTLQVKEGRHGDCCFEPLGNAPSQTLLSDMTGYDAHDKEGEACLKQNGNRLGK